MIALSLSMLVILEDPGRVQPDRPNIANSAEIVAPGAVQIEAGIDGQLHGYASKDQFACPRRGRSASGTSSTSSCGVRGAVAAHRAVSVAPTGGGVAASAARRAVAGPAGAS